MKKSNATIYENVTKNPDEVKQLLNKEIIIPPANAEDPNPNPEQKKEEEELVSDDSSQSDKHSISSDKDKDPSDPAVPPVDNPEPAPQGGEKTLDQILSPQVYAQLTETDKQNIQNVFASFLFSIQLF